MAQSVVLEENGVQLRIVSSRQAFSRVVSSRQYWTCMNSFSMEIHVLAAFCQKRSCARSVRSFSKLNILPGLVAWVFKVVAPSLMILHQNFTFRQQEPNQSRASLGIEKDSMQDNHEWEPLNFHLTGEKISTILPILLIQKY